MPRIKAGSAFATDYEPVADWSDFKLLSNGKTRREISAAEREKQVAKGNTGTIAGLSARSDGEIFKQALIRKNSRV